MVGFKKLAGFSIVLLTTAKRMKDDCEWWQCWAFSSPNQQEAGMGFLESFIFGVIAYFAYEKAYKPMKEFRRKFRRNYDCSEEEEQGDCSEGNTDQ